MLTHARAIRSAPAPVRRGSDVPLPHSAGGLLAVQGLQVFHVCRRTLPYGSSVAAASGQ